jgi:hypothetical protein
LGCCGASLWSGLFPSIPTYHCFGEAYVKSERLAARSRPFQVCEGDVK